MKTSLKERAEKLKKDIPTIFPALPAASIKLIPSDVMERCQRESADMWDGGKPRRWYYAIPFALIWLLIIWHPAKTEEVRYIHALYAEHGMQIQAFDVLSVIKKSRSSSRIK